MRNMLISLFVHILIWNVSYLFYFRTKEPYEYANFGSRMESGEYQFFQATIFALRSFYNSFIPRGSQLSTFQYLLDGCSLTNIFSFSLAFVKRIICYFLHIFSFDRLNLQSKLSLIL